jgi:PAS domain S-box-containing protein
VNFSTWRQIKIRQWLGAGIGVLVLLALGVLFAQWSGARQSRWMREDLLYQTRMFAQTLHMDRLTELEGTAADEAKPEYQRLKGQLISASRINPDWEFVYLMDRTESGDVVFLLDSEPPDAPDPSPPGQVYEEASADLHQVFETGESAVEGPLPDRWGVWVSALVPLKDLKTGEIAAVVGIDINANLWNQARVHAMRVPAACALLLIFIWLTGCALLARRARPGTCKTWLCWHLESLLLAATGLTLTLSGAWLAQGTQLHNRQISFRHLAQIEVAPPFTGIHALRNLALEGFASFVESSEVVTKNEFHEYIEHLTEMPEVLFWNWVQAVPQEDRKQFEAQRNQYSPDGEYRIWEWNNRGEAIPSPKRQNHFPLIYAAPENHALKLEGFDFGSSQEIHGVMETLIQTRLASASEPCTFFITSGKDNGILLLRPVFNPEDPDQLLGMVTAGLDIKQWLRSGRDTDPDRLLMATLDLFELYPTAPPRYIGSSGQSDPTDAHEFASLPPESVIRPLLIFGNAYALVAHPTTAFTELHPINAAGLISLAGSALTFALAWVLGLYVHRRERLSQLVDDQNRELATAMHRYDLLAQQNHIVTWEVDSNGLYIDVSPTAAAVYGYSPKELIGKKHYYDLHPAAGRLEFKASTLAAIRSEEPIRDLLNPIATKSGKTLWVSTSGIPSRDEEGKLVSYWGTDTDVTDRKHAEESLAQLAQANQEAADRFATLIRASNTGAWEYNDSTGDLWCGPEYFSMLGYTQADLAPAQEKGSIEAYWLDLMHPDDRPRAMSKQTVYLKKPEGMYEQTFRMKHRDGHWVWIWSRGQVLRDTNGNPTHMMVGTHIDISATKQAEEALRSSEKQYRMLTESMKDVVWTLDVESRRFLYLSPSAEKLTGYTADELMAHPLDAALPPEVRDELIDRLNTRAAKLRTGEITSDTFFTSEVPLTHKSGAPIVAELITRYWMNTQTGKVELQAVARDITERKRVERNYQTLFQEMLEGFALHEIICDDSGTPVDYRFLAVNPSFERMTGLQAGTLVGKTILEALPETNPSWIKRYSQVALSGEPVFFDDYSEALHKHFEITAFRPAPNQFACIFSDITDRKQAEHELKESRRRYAALLANLPGMAYRCSNDRAWTMEFVSQGCMELTGYQPDDLVNSKTIPFNDIICPTYRDHIWEKWQQSLQARRTFEAEYEITTRSGATKWVWEQGEGVYDDADQLIALEGFIADITERKHAGAERERLTRAIEQSGETIVITDAEGTIVYVNPAFTRTSGYTREEAIGQNMRILKSGHQDANFYQNMWKILSTGATWEGQLINQRKDGTLFTEQASISPVRDVTGHIIYYVAVKRDITEQLRDQKEKSDLQTQLVQAQKMESIGRLAGGVAHDFNNMLQAIQGYTEMAIEQVPKNKPLYSDLQEIQKVAKRSAALTKQLQTFARKQMAQPTALQLNDALEGMSSMLQRLIGEDMELIWKPGAHLGMVKMDPGQLDQIVANLCVNARDALGKSGHITIETRNAEITKADVPLHHGIKSGHYVQLSIQDNGSGMTPDVMAHLFEPFFTTKKVGKGTGLGLSTVYGIVKQNHGHIEVESHLKKGSAFRIYLPVFSGKVKAVPEEEMSEPSASGPESILLVEDEKTILLTTCRMLESLGYKVYATASPIEALQLAERHKGQLNLLLTDVIMPGMNGPELVQQILPRDPKLKYLFMSGYTANLIEKQGVKTTLAGFIQKPFSRKALAQKVRAAIDVR